jgi:hypothetical protein
MSTFSSVHIQQSTMAFWTWSQLETNKKEKENKNSNKIYGI